MVFLFFNILDLKKYNTNGFIKKCITTEEVNVTLRNLNPVLFHHGSNYNIDDVILDYGDYIENMVFEERDSIDIKEDKPLLKIIDKSQLPSFFTESRIPTINNESISIYKNYQSNLESCNSNHTVIYIVDGVTTLYIFNPKHKDEIKDKPLKSIKKWAHIKELKKGDYLIIPTNWLYFLETQDKCILYTNKVNNIFTIIPNVIKDNYSSFTLPDFMSSVN
jgi:hypothetical protein